MIEAPENLDGAKVIKWAWSGDNPFGFVPITNNETGSESIEIFGLAICQYEDSDHVYRFSCDKYWEVQPDGVYESVEDALRHLPDQYKLATPEWKTK